MSGSSLDGLDMAFCEMHVSGTRAAPKISWQLLQAETIPYDETWRDQLHHLPDADALTFTKTHAKFGRHMGKLVSDFLCKHQLHPDFIASHGHTIFHYPIEKFTAQIGDGAALAAVSGYPVICDFRTQDIALGGEGTPLAPIADKFLFPGKDFYFNIGGIANISCITPTKIIAFGVGPANQILNTLAQLMDLEYDDCGNIARRGELNLELYSTINVFPYFQQGYPKSLDNRWVQKNILPVYLNYHCSVEDKLRTAVEQLAQETALALKTIIEKERLKKEHYSLFITGGGAFNDFLISRINEHCNKIATVKLEIPEKRIVQFKEALLMALMGVLRIENIPNCFGSVTGAHRDVIGGAIFQGSKKII